MSKVYIVLSLDHATDKVTTPEAVYSTVQAAQDRKQKIEQGRKLAFVVEREVDLDDERT